ncbi:hypothetical protein BLA29_004053 [Euroglyphus maynei]|uniref:Secreted protein n=1 Tax=Euroglyphus maynei TaxID=6958 RepID=A0A1Y3BEH1_EURMA|nr:hypothetical protein BLA29_004053 [Euroglyphus maynei]
MKFFFMLRLCGCVRACTKNVSTLYFGVVYMTICEIFSFSPFLVTPWGGRNGLDKFKDFTLSLSFVKNTHSE